MDVRIGLFLEEKSKVLAYKYSDEMVKKISSRFVLDENNIPHVTLLHVHIEEIHLGPLTRIVKGIADNQTKILTYIAGIKADPLDPTYIWLYFRNESEIVQLRDAVNAATNKYFAHVSSFIQPHITLTRTEEKEEFHQEIIPKHTTILLDKLAIWENGENGVCNKVIFSHSLV